MARLWSLLLWPLCASAAHAPLEPDYSPLPSVRFEYKKADWAKELSGQVFIATKGGDNVEMGAVDIYLFPKEYWLKTGGVIANRFLAYEQKMESLRNLRRKERDITSVVKLHDDENVRRRRLWARLLPDTPFVGKTDANGRFAIDHDIAETIVVFAQARRLVGRDTEHYLWVVEVSPAQRTVLLTNDNHR